MAIIGESKTNPKRTKQMNFKFFMFKFDLNDFEMFIKRFLRCVKQRGQTYYLTIYRLV